MHVLLSVEIEPVFTLLGLSSWIYSCDVLLSAVACMICVLVLAALPVAMIVIGKSTYYIQKSTSIKHNILHRNHAHKQRILL